MLSADHLVPAVRPDGISERRAASIPAISIPTAISARTRHNATGSTVIAAHEGKVPADYYHGTPSTIMLPQSDKDVEEQPGGLDAAGHRRQRDGTWRIAGAGGSTKEMSLPAMASALSPPAVKRKAVSARKTQAAADERSGKENTPLVINLDNLVVGDVLFQQRPQHAGPVRKRPATARWLSPQQGYRRLHQPRDSTRLIRKAPAAAMTPASSTTPIPVLSVEATNWSLGKKMAISSGANRQFRREPVGMTSS